MLQPLFRLCRSVAAHGPAGLAAALLASVIAAAPAGADTIRIGMGVDASHSPFFVANQRGLFKKAGLDVSLVRFTQGGEAVDALVAGQVEVAEAADVTMMLRMARAPLMPLAIFEESGRIIKLTVGAKINDIKEMKKFGIVKGSVSEYSTNLALKKFEIDPKSVQMVAAGPAELPALLVRGDIDGYFVWEPWPALGVKQGGKLLLTSGDVGYAYTMWLSTTPAYFASHRPELEKLLAVLKEADAIITGDMEAAAKDVNAQTKVPVADVLAILKETTWKVRDFTPQDIASFEQVAAFLAANKATPALLDVKALVKPGFVKD